MLLFFCFIPFNTLASESVVAMLNGKYYDLLEDAIKNANDNDTITILSDMTLDNRILINKTITINLNNHTISANNIVFRVEGGTLNLIGKGTLKEINPEYSPLLLKGSQNKDDTNYTNVSVSKDINLYGWSGIFIDQNNGYGYGITVNFSGNIQSVLDITSSKGFGIYINGKIKDTYNYPVINILDDASIDSLGVGLYMAGYSKVNIKGENIKITGLDSAIAIKSGILTIDDGTFIVNGKKVKPVTGNNSGINESGSTIQIESNKNYKGNIELYINNGTFESKNSNNIYEYVYNSSNTNIKNIKITNGKFITYNNNNVFDFSSNFNDKNLKFITGGVYKTDPSRYVVSGYKVKDTNDFVVETFKEVEEKEKVKSKKVIIIGITFLLVLVIVGYLIKGRIII